MVKSGVFIVVVMINCLHLKSSVFHVVCDRVRSFFLEESRRSPVGSNAMLSI
jgi:hypothetical protein